jgi:hypothetical protein
VNKQMLAENNISRLRMQFSGRMLAEHMRSSEFQSPVLKNKNKQQENTTSYPLDKCLTFK